MKKLASVLLLLALAGCGGKHLGPNELAVPVWACSQTPTGESRVVKEQEYCGKACWRDVERKQYAIEVKCNYVEWQRQ